METIKKDVLQKEDELDKFLSQYCNPPLFTQDGQNEIKKHLSILEMDKERFLIREGQLSNCIFYLISGAVRSFYIKVKVFSLLQGGMKT